MPSYSQKSFQDDIQSIRTMMTNNVSSVAIWATILQMLEVPYTDDEFILELLKLQSQLKNLNIPLEEFVGRPLTIYNPASCSLLGVIKRNNANRPSVPITITMTTCKRFDLFIQTVNSFLACCQDLEQYIIDWIVVDDNSSLEDRNKMIQLYPFITWIWKDSTQKGHAKSMNMLRERVLANGSKFVFHLEDDWRFFLPDRWITKCLTVLADNPKYGQCLLNRTYGEDLQTGAQIWGGHRRYVKYSPGEFDPQKMLRYYIHEYATGDSLNKIHEYLSSRGLASCAYWPHFSFRVGLTRVEVFQDVGSFSESAEHFEREYAGRYRVKWLTTYLDNIACSHIGRRTYERSGPKLNAYDLNQERQFGEARKAALQDTDEIKLDAVSAASRATPEQKPPISLKVYVLNLKRRPDRLQKFRDLNRRELPYFHIFDAVDGKKLQPNLTIQRLFQPNDYNYRRGIVGCALSHLLMWTELADSPLTGMLIIEDDAELTPGFIPKTLQLIEDTPEADIIFLHHHSYATYTKAENFLRDKLPRAERWSKQESQRYSMGGTTAYWISKKGAQNLVYYINLRGIQFGIDWMMFYADTNKVYYSTPYLAFADCAQSTGVDTDIQNVYDGIGLGNQEDWLKAEIAYWNESGLRGRFSELASIPENISSRIICQETQCSKSDLLQQMNLFRRTREMENWLSSYPIHWLGIGKYILSVPDSSLKPKDTTDRIWFGYFNNSAIMSVVKDAVS